MRASVLPSTAAEHRFLFDWLERGARRMRARACLRECGRVLCILLATIAAYLLCEALRVPSPVLAALAPLMLLAGGAGVALFGWRCMRRPHLFAVAAEADARGALKDELKSACWFAHHGAPAVWESAMLHQTAEKMRALDPRDIFPLRFPGSFAACAVLGAIVFALAFGGGVAEAPGDSGAAIPADGKAEARAAGAATARQSETAFAFAALAATSAPSDPRQAGLWSRAEALIQSLKDDQQAELQRAVRARDAVRVHELLQSAEQEIAAAAAGADARARPSHGSADARESMLERRRSLLAPGSPPKPEALRPASDESLVPRLRDEGARETRNDADQQGTMQALDDALRALSQAATGDRPMGNGSPPGQPSQDDSGTNIDAGPAGMRVNASEAGEGGEDAPPDAPSEGGGGSVLGKPTERLAARLQRLDSGAAQGEPATPGMEGAYAATRAQAAHVGLTPVQLAPQRARDGALMREQIPLAYQASVKRYFLTEHSKER